jgi:ABC-type transporter lipoprotein component MlaA
MQKTQSASFMTLIMQDFANNCAKIQQMINPSAILHLSPRFAMQHERRFDLAQARA